MIALREQRRDVTPRAIESYLTCSQLAIETSFCSGHTSRHTFFKPSARARTEDDVERMKFSRRPEKLQSRPATRWKRAVDALARDIHLSPPPDTNSLSLINARSKTEDAATLCRIFGSAAITSRIGLSELRGARVKHSALPDRSLHGAERSGL